jgi:Mn2+/Fe2+ NRAMP family transporter
VLVVLWLFERPKRFRILEVAVMALIALIFVCFVVELSLAKPS